jgi:hypothetical protein
MKIAMDGTNMQQYTILTTTIQICNNNNKKRLEFQQMTKKIKHAFHRKVFNYLRKILRKLNHLYKSVCNKLECINMVVDFFFRNNKFTRELVSVSVSKISRNIERIERQCLISPIKRYKLVPLRDIES